MSGNVTQEETTGRARSGAMSAGQDKVDPKRITWVKELTDAADQADEKTVKNKARSDAIGSATGRLKTGTEGLAGLDFKLLIKKDADFKARALALFGQQGQMKSLTGTGDAMNEIDTVHDLDKLEAIDGPTLTKAVESLKLVADASQQLDGDLMDLYAKDFKIDPEEFARLDTMRKQDRHYEEESRKPSNNKLNGADDKPPERSKEDKAALAEFEKLRAKVEKEVRDEVWQPLVRQGLIPENMVPDIHSEVARTFEGASAQYQARLEEYTKEKGDNANLIDKLGLAKKIVDQGLKVASAIANVPGLDAPAKFIDMGVECATILSDTGFQVAGQVLQKDDALNIAQTVAQGASGLMAASGVVPAEVQLCVDSGIQIALTGGKAVKGIMDGKPKDVLAALTSGLTQSLNLAAQVSGNPDVAMAARAAVAAVSTGSKAATFTALMLRKNPKPTGPEIQAALSDLVTAGVKDVATAVSMAMEAEQARGKISGQTAKTVDQATQIATDGAAGLVGAALGKDKADALAKALGNIASDCCSAYLPGGYGSQVGAALKTSISGSPALATAIASGKPDEALSVFGGMLATGLTNASKIGSVDAQVAKGLKDAGAAIKALKAEATALAAFKKAVKDGDVAGVKKAGTSIVNSLMDPILDQVDPDALSADGTFLDAGDDEDEAADDGGAQALRETEEDFAAKRRAVIAKADAIIKKGGPPEEIEKEKAKRDGAIKELLERSAFTEAIAADAKDFEDMLNSDLDAPEDDGDTRTLEKLITTIQRDRKIMQMADALVGMGLKAAAVFFAPVGIAMDFKTFAVEACKAVAHLQQLLLWKKNASEARNAVTVQVHTMLNRVGLEEDALDRAPDQGHAGADLRRGQHHRDRGRACGAGRGGDRRRRQGGERGAGTGADHKVRRRDGDRVAGVSDGFGEPQGPQADPGVAAEERHHGQIRAGLGSDERRQPHRHQGAQALRPVGRDHRQGGRQRRARRGVPRGSLQRRPDRAAGGPQPEGVGLDAAEAGPDAEGVDGVPRHRPEQGQA